MLNKKQLGNTGISTTCMGLGLAALGRPGYINLGHATDLNNSYDMAKMEKHCHFVLDKAWERGIRYFDAARSYGRAEQFLASWLRTRNIKATEITVGSKWGYTYTADWKIEALDHEVKEHSISVLDKQWHESNALLGEWLKLYQIHSATIESGVLKNSKVLSRLALMKSEKIAIGLSLSGVKQAVTLEKAMTIEIDGVRLFDTVQATWNLLETSAGLLLQRAREQGMGIIIKEGLANGRLTSRNDEADFVKKKTLLGKIAAEHNTTFDAVALGHILRQSWVDVVLSGATTIEQLDSNIKAVELTDLADLNIAEKANVYWKKRSVLPWN